MFSVYFGLCFFMLDAFLKNLLILGWWLIFTSEAFKSWLEALCMDRTSSLVGPTMGGFREVIQMSPFAQLPAFLEPAEGKEQGASHLVCKLSANTRFSICCLSLPILVPVSPDQHLLVEFSLWRIKVSPGCWVSKAGTALWWDGVRDHSGASLFWFGAWSISKLQMAPVSELSVILWQESAHFSLAPSLGVSRFFFLYPAKSVSFSAFQTV